MEAGKEKTRRVSTFINLKMFDLVTRISKAKGSALLVMYSLARHHSDVEGCARPSTALIAAETHMSIRNVHRVMDALEASGEVGVYRQKDQVNRYYIQLKDTPDGKLEFARRVMKSATEDSGKYRPVAGRHDASRMTTSSRGTGQPRHATTGQGRHAAHDKVVTLIINEQSEEETRNIQWPPATLEAVSSGTLEEVERRLADILKMKGNRSRGKNKRYACKLTLEELTRLTSSLLKERPADLLLEALVNFTDGDGFTDSRAFVQKLSLRKWVLGQKPPLMDTVKGLLAQVDKPTQKALIRQARDGQEDLEYITSDELHDLHESLVALG